MTRTLGGTVCSRTRPSSRPTLPASLSFCFCAKQAAGHDTASDRCLHGATSDYDTPSRRRAISAALRHASLHFDVQNVRFVCCLR